MKAGTFFTIVGGIAMLSLASTHGARAASIEAEPAAPSAAAAQVAPALQTPSYDAPILKHSDLPEPATWAMLILGVGGIGVVMRRGRANRAAAAAHH